MAEVWRIADQFSFLSLRKGLLAAVEFPSFTSVDKVLLIRR